MSCLDDVHQYNALAFTAAWALGYRAYTIPTLNLPTASILDGASSSSSSSMPSLYSTLREIGKHSEQILLRMPEVKAEKAAADIHAVPKFCEGLDIRYTPHKSSPCACRAVEVIAEISEKGIARPLSIEPVRGKAAEEGKKKKTVVVEELERITTLLEKRCGRVQLEVDAEYTKSRDALKFLISSGWEFTTRIRSDSLLGREVRDAMLSSSELQVYGKWYRSEEYGGRFQIVGRRILRGGETIVILHLSTRRLSPEKVIEERRDRWRIENLFKNVDIDSTPGNDYDEIRGYYTLAFFMAEMGRAFRASTKTIGLIMDREGRVTVKNGVMKLYLKGLDRRLLRKTASYVDCVNRLRKGRAKLHYKLITG